MIWHVDIKKTFIVQNSFKLYYPQMDAIDAIWFFFLSCCVKQKFHVKIFFDFHWIKIIATIHTDFSSRLHQNSNKIRGAIVHVYFMDLNVTYLWLNVLFLKITHNLPFKALYITLKSKITRKVIKKIHTFTYW